LPTQPLNRAHLPQATEVVKNTLQLRPQFLIMKNVLVIKEEAATF